MTQEKDSKDNFSGLRKRAEESVDRKVSDMEDISALISGRGPTAGP